MSCASSTTTKSYGRVGKPAKCSAKRLNMPGLVTRAAARSFSQTLFRTFQAPSRCASDSRVLRPSRLASRYASQVESCHASAISSHSPRRNRSVSFFSAGFQAALIASSTTVSGAIFAAPK